MKEYTVPITINRMYLPSSYLALFPNCLSCDFCSLLLIYSYVFLVSLCICLHVLSFLLTFEYFIYPDCGNLHICLSDLTQWMLDNFVFYVNRMNEGNVKELGTNLHKS